VARISGRRQRGSCFLRQRNQFLKTHDCQSIVGFLLFTLGHGPKQILKGNMKKTYQVQTRFGPETRFEVAPVAAVPFRGVQETELDQLKTRLLKQLLNQTPDPSLNAPLRRAANEAAGLAWLTPFPLLLFPTLLEEKAAVAARQQVRQRQIKARTQRLIEDVVA
jgi:hypothetical protein